jgi:hypothetical protein
MLVHPRCACTQASISELARLQRQIGGLAQIAALLVIPEDADPDFAATSAAARLREIPGALVIPDPGGREARRFGAATSGHVLLYDQSGSLRYSGGITPGRGHEGDSIGRDSLVSYIRQGRALHTEAPVFGCKLAGPTDGARDR